MRFAILLAAASVVASGAMAQSATTDWSGFYAGLSAGGYSGMEDFGPDGSSDYDLSGASRGVFAGYNWTNGAFVYGGELAYTSGEAKENGLSGGSIYPEYNYSDFIELKGRVGYSVGAALIYGALGYAMGDYDYSGVHYDVDGAVYGVGVDYAFGKYFAGAEYLRRDLRSDYPTDADVDTLSVRFGMKF